MAIDSKLVKEFWEKRAKTHNDNSGLTNLEPDEKRRDLKVTLEEEKVFKYLNLSNHKRVLDLGGGYGVWAFKFALDVNHVTVVEYCKELIDLGKKKAVEKGLRNVSFIESSAQDFVSDKKFDIIYISGLMIYLNDEEIEQLFRNLKSYSKTGTEVVLRDSTGILGRYEINNKYSEALNAHYSALYRTPEEYIELFKKSGFALVKHEDMFGDGCELNKFPETRLRIYKFKKNEF